MIKWISADDYCRQHTQAQIDELDRRGGRLSFLEHLMQEVWSPKYAGDDEV